MLQCASAKVIGRIMIACTFEVWDSKRMPDTPRSLICMPFSPWSEQAMWALDHHRLPYKRHMYTPLIEVPWLRMKTGRWRGPVTVPVLIENKQVWRDSWEIAKRAEEVGFGSPLFLKGQEQALRMWHERIEAFILENAKVEFKPDENVATLRVVSAA